MKASDLKAGMLDTLHDNERLKARSRHLRGDIAAGLEEALTGAVPGDDPLLMKFHGIYQQDDRDRRVDRQRRHLEPAWQFMVRMRIPGGELAREQWLGIDRLSRDHSERGIRITTRQTIQLHGVRKAHLRPLMQGLRDIGLDTIAACGDDSRGVVCSANPHLTSLHGKVAELARATSDRLIPKTGAYREIWYGQSAPPSDEEEPIYGDLYLPRKFKVGYAIPPINDIDVYGQDLGFIAVTEGGQLLGFNVCVGGGMGKLDTRDDSYPRLAECIGFIPPEEAPEFSEVVMTIQRDFGDRQDRHRARFKYTLDVQGTHWFIEELERRRGKPLEQARSIEFSHNGDRFGWEQGEDDLWHATLYIESGRVDDALRAQLSALLTQYGGRLRMTTNQNLQLTHIPPWEVEQVRWRLDDLGLSWRLAPDPQAARTLSCVALPTCGLAMAEAERYTPQLLSVFQKMKAVHALDELPIHLRITGCPNGCARPYLAEVALTGRAPGLYNLYLGGSPRGDRLATLYAGNVNEERFIELLDPMLASFAAQRQKDEAFGDFLHRKKLIEATPVALLDP